MSYEHRGVGACGLTLYASTKPILKNATVKYCVWGGIYSKAEKVIVWLGIGSDDSDLAVDLFEALALGERNADASDDDLNWETAIDWMYEPSIYHRYVKHWAAFDSLLERRYWKRVWIIQEIAFGTRVLCQCGSRSFWWSTLASAIKKIRDLDLGKVVIQDQPSKIYMNAETINGIERMRSYRRHADCYLLKILRSVGDAVSTDPKDRIYGFLALANDGKQLLPHPDYGLSIEDIYIETMRRIISDNRDLDVMLSVKRKSNLCIPSWVVDWGDGQESRIWDLTWSESEDEMNATRDPSQDLRTWHMGGFVHDGMVLKARGLIFDVADGIGAPLWGDIDTPLGDMAIRPPRYYLSPYNSLQEAFNALWKCLILNHRSFTSGSPDFLHSLFVLAEEHTSGGPGTVYTDLMREWYELYKGFEIHGRSIKAWFKDFAGERRGHRHNPESEQGARDMSFLCELIGVSAHKKLMTTDQGYIGMGPHETKRGDKICLLLGCRAPVVLRERERDQRGYRLLGSAYVHGIMLGEAMTEENMARMEDFYIH